MAGTSAPGLSRPGLASPGVAAAPGSPGIGVRATWTATRGITSGTGIPDPPSMPLECPVSNTGDTGSGMVALASWTLPDGYAGADMAVSDDAGNVWWPLGAPSAASPATGLTRCSIWASPGAFAASNVYVSPVGLPSACYPAVIGVTVLEVAGMSPYLGTPAVVSAAQNSGTIISAPCAAPSANALMVAVAASSGTVAPAGPGTAWASLAGVSGSGGAYSLSSAPAWQVSAGSQSASWTVAASADLSAASAVILASNPAPSQPAPDWPAFSFQMGLGSGALTPPGQIAWTDLTSRWLAGAETTWQAGKPYELDTLQAAEITLTLDDNNGDLTPGNSASQYYPGVTADVPARLIGWWGSRTYGVLAGWAERLPVHWDETWYGLTQVTATDAWSLQQNQLSSVQREEISWDTNLYSYWTCSDAAGSPSAQNLAPGNTNALVVAESKNGAGAAVQVFGADSGALPGDQSGSFWSQTGVNTQGYGYCLYCADQGYPLLSGSGVTLAGWFSPVLGPSTQVDSSSAVPAYSVILLRGSNAASGPMFQVHLYTAGASHPGGLGFSVWDVSTGTRTDTDLSAQNWLSTIPAGTTGFFHITLKVTQSTWTAYINGAEAATGACNLPASFSWLEFLGSADRQYTGSMCNGECGHLAVFGTALTADRIRAIFLAGTPDPVHSGGTSGAGTTSAVTGAQFAGDYPQVRIERLLSYGGWTGARSISQSSTTPMAGISDIQGNSAVIAASGQVTVSTDGQQAAQAAGNIVFSDGGFLFTDGCGVLCYWSRGDFYTMTRKWTLGEDTASGEIPYLPTAILGYDKSLLYNGAELTPSSNVSNAPVVATSTSSIAAHGEYVFNSTAYQQDVNQIADEANWIVNTRGVVRLRAEQLTADAMANPAVWPFMLGARPAQPLTVWRRPQTASYSVEFFPLLSQITRTLDFQSGTATLKLGTDAFPEGTVLIIGDATRGQATGSNILGW